MKYIVVLGDGMADRKLENLGNKTPLESARTPNLDALAARSEIGMCKTVPDGMKPGSDVANLSVLGYDPKQGYTGRSPLEAVSIGIPLRSTDVTMRCNLVTVSDEENYEDKRMIDYSAGEISTREANELIEYLKTFFDDEKFTLYSGVSYRHCLVIDKGETGNDLTPPHDITERPVRGHLPQGKLQKELLGMMRRSYELLKDHPVNLARIAAGKRPANSVWFWGEGTKPALENYEKKFGVKGGVISAVDLVKGIGMLAGMQILDVEGATGNYDTNFQGKADAALSALLNGLDLVYIHMEAPDECGHQGDVKHKIFSIEEIDRAVVGTLVKGLNDAKEPFRMLVCPDHPTPICIRTHTSDPVPYLLYDSEKDLSAGAARYDEEHAEATGVFVEDGYLLMQKLLNK
ncbi:cofactor-independent phosphoglycerate mutase [Candidatus Borkfalkia ceftriaxoniphila]|uniref:Cofactor-independent phosphoglycerate mutase n=1 Tax=Candidatus Borkfalkia ceftriaxoniphila TaxID=2508949 RepID=A0A4Q2K9J6_9FIRM|nr:cofactor-independent phosphoglycerate mutase [Candidatus Borkfalkia ceftriaxoniphila]RXZ58256.1 cofactor-independent phosphoglycerate mutase [Candidatus Borkfalkia ceftriaxoniphila]